MALLRRFSDGVWSFLSPHRLSQSPARHGQPTTEPETPSLGMKSGLVARPRANLDAGSLTSDGKRKRPDDELSSFSKRFKTRLDAGHGSHASSGDGSNCDSDEIDSDRSLSPMVKSSDLLADLDDSVVIDEEEYERDAGNRRKLVNLPEEATTRGVSTDELIEAGWDDDHIQLVHKIAMRGYEPLLPAHYKWDYNFMPDGLFSEDDDAFIGSIRKQHFHSIKALENLFETGGRARDRLHLTSGPGPEDIVRRKLEDYMKWARNDANLSAKSAMPNLIVHARSAATPSSVLQAQAHRKLAQLYARYKDAFQIQQSIENSPWPDSVTLTHTIPQLYAVIASSTVVVLVAYRPETEQEIRPVVFFDFRNKNYDVWNALALAIVVNHCRNVQLRIAADTGLGGPEISTGAAQDADDDPDL